MARAAVIVLIATFAIPEMSARAADAPVFEGAGRAPISAGDRVQARQRALDGAFRETINAALSAMLGPEALVKRAAELRLNVLPKARSYVTTYRIVGEGDVEGSLYEVRISAEVAADRLLRDLGDRNPANPKLPAAIADKRAIVCTATDPSAPWPRLDGALRAMLAAHAFDPVPAAGCGDDELVRAMKSANARIALSAMIVGDPPSTIRGTALLGRQGRLVLRLVEPDGRRSAEGTGDGAGFGASIAIADDDLAMRALAQAGPPIEQALETLGGVRGVVGARLLNVHKLAQVSELRGALARIAGVESVEPRRFVPGAVELQVKTSLSPQAVASAFARVAATYHVHVRQDGATVVVEAEEQPGEGITP